MKKRISFPVFYGSAFLNRGYLRFFLAVFWVLTCLITDKAEGLDGNTTADVQWKAGVAGMVITPEVPMWQDGWARNRLTSEKSQDIWVKALAIEDVNGRQSILFTTDLCGITAGISNAVADEIRKTHQIDRSGVLFTATHNHASPYIEGYLPVQITIDRMTAEEWYQVKQYRKELEQTMVRIAHEAISSMEPVRLSWGNGFADFGVNRRNNPEDQVPDLRANGLLKGPVDHDVPVLRITDQQDRIKAVVFSYASHAVVYPGYTWNGDYPGYAQEALENRHVGATAFFVAGAGGDNRPMPRGTIEFARKYGERLADAVDRVLFDDMYPIEGNSKTAFGLVNLEFQSIPGRRELIEETMKVVEGASSHEPGSPYRRLWARHLLGVIEKAGPLSSAYPYPVQIWKFGTDLTLVALGGEVVVDYSLRLKRELGSGTWVAAYCNDVMGYIPSERVLEEDHSIGRADDRTTKGYEGSTSHVPYGLPSPWAPGLEDKIISTVTELIKELNR